jgi:hypothetical protein
MNGQGRRRFACYLALALLMCVDASFGGPRRPTTGRAAAATAGTPSTQPRPKPLHSVGTLGYDNDIPFSRDGGVDIPIGNRFTPTAGQQSPFHLMTVTFRAAGCYPTPFTGQRVTVWVVSPTLMHAQQVEQWSAGGLCTGTSGALLRTGMLPNPFDMHGPFIVAIRNSPFSGCAGNTMVGGTCDGVALSEGAIDPGMGFHAIRMTNSEATLPNMGNRNAILRATNGNLPIELMNLDVEG